MSFYVQEYKKIINNILFDAIKSAIYIDENALEPYTRESTKNTDLDQTQKLSKDLYKLFCNNHVALTVHKFINVQTTKPFLNSKDLILLDWHLDGVTSGEEFALEILEDIVKEEHIHFCCIYTNNNIDDVLSNCMSYFSGHDQAYYNLIVDEFEFEDVFNEQIQPYLDKILSLPLLSNIKEIARLRVMIWQSNQSLVYSIENASCFSQDIDFANKLKSLAIAYSSLKKSPNSTYQIKKSEITKKVLFINNTIVFVIKKDHGTDKRKLINKIREQLLLENNSYLLMLGVEMQNNIKRSSAFISTNLIDIEDKTLAYHWKQNIKNNHEVFFRELMNNVMIDQIENNCLKKEFKLFESSILHSRITCPDISELSKLNVFYNGSVLPDDRIINFGDIFLGNNGDYFLCITPLCDCLQPENINNRYFFVKGKKHPSIKTAIKLGDQAFLSYIDSETCIIWSGFSNNNRGNIDKYLPIYIKPVQLFIPKPKIDQLKIKYLEYKQEIKGDNIENKVSEIGLNYKFTLRKQYAQRIANYAFSHSIRVGIDFVKK
ncbi:MAG: response regulator receiver domain [Candidatus Nanoarchaeia archaeon]|nr:response regulator receiver domain [Candidatus Nanoarchaeia archaeon]